MLFGKICFFAAEELIGVDFFKESRKLSDLREGLILGLTLKSVFSDLYVGKMTYTF